MKNNCMGGRYYRLTATLDGKMHMCNYCIDTGKVRGDKGGNECTKRNTGKKKKNTFASLGY